MKNSRFGTEIRSLVSLGTPVALAHLAGIAMQIVDTFFVGRLGPEALAGISVGNAVFVVPLITGIGLLLGLEFLGSHAYGSKDYHECHRLLTHGLVIATVTSMISIFLLMVFANHFELIGVASSVANEGKRYLSTLTLSLFPFLLFIAFRQYLQAMSVATPVLLTLLVANLLNAFANWVLVFGNLGFPALGIRGSGLATLCARIFMVIAVVYYTWWRDRRLHLGLFKSGAKIWQLSLERFRRMLKLSVPIAAQLVLEVGVFVASTLIIARIGTVAVAAHQIVIQIASFTFMLPLGLSSAAAVRIGQALGRKEKKLAISTGWTALGLALFVMACTALCLLVFARPILSAFTSIENVKEMAHKFLFIAALFQIWDGLQVVGSGVLRGIGNTRASLLANLIGHWCIGIPAGYFLAFGLKWGAQGIWAGLSIGLGFVAISLVLFWKVQSTHISKSVEEALTT